ncbi:MAG: radical SAM protein [Bacillota bacterium]
MAECLAVRGAAPSLPLLDRVFRDLARAGYSRLGGRKGAVARTIRERMELGIEPHSSFLFVFPGATEGVSSTGDRCALNCSHCGGHYLRGMTPAAELRDRLTRGEEVGGSWLISGGCDCSGRVPPPAETLLARLSERGRLNFHVGLAGEKQIRAAARFADSVSFDLIGSDRTVARVMGLDARAEDYFDAYRECRRRMPPGVPVVAHLVAGLDGGEIIGEYRVLDFLAEQEPEAVVLLVLRPTPGTAFAGVQPPPLEEVCDLMLHARSSLPRARLALGCMRPSGRYRLALDLLAVACDFDVLVQPTRPARSRAAQVAGERGIRWGDECCALYAGPTAAAGAGQFADLSAFRQREER